MFDLKKVIGIAFLVLLLLLLRATVFKVDRVPGHAMSPILHERDLVLVNRMAYFRREPEREDIVAFRYPQNEKLPPLHKVTFFKRIIGMPNEELKYEDGHLFINDQLYKPRHRKIGKGSKTIMVGHDEYYLIGDNAEKSYDLGIPTENVIGKAIFVLSPSEHRGGLQ